MGAYSRELKNELADIREELKAQRLNGQEHSFVGSHSRKGVDYSVLKRREQEIVGMLARLNGGTTRVLPDFS